MSKKDEVQAFGDGWRAGVEAMRREALSCIVGHLTPEQVRSLIREALPTPKKETP